MRWGVWNRYSRYGEGTIRIMYQHRKRDLQYWLDKDKATWNKTALLRSEIMQLEFYTKHAPSRRYPGKLRSVTKRRWDGSTYTVQTNLRVFAFRNHQQWRGAHKGWFKRVTKLAKARKRLKMIQETKVPYYRERIKTLGGKPFWE